MKKVKKIFLYLLNLPLYWISRLVPKDENIWIFGAWFGEKYADNSKYLFEYMSKNHPEIRAIWLTTNKSTLDLIKSKGYESYSTYSLKGYYFSARANFSFVSTAFNDVNIFIPSKCIINLWHGNPLKKVV
ncbi:MAG: CDP-glycerol glycerophosphotransferase family protein, partial [Epsilonproteobacteria bacterium]|nr:CDP-glycerol glycerophosphotransferase family protein [Campylobacterota bacterium]